MSPMSVDVIVLTVPARHLTPGDHFNGMTVMSLTRIPGREMTFKLVIPFTTHTMSLSVQEKDLDAISFPLTKRGDDYSPNARNAALGLPPVPEKVYVAPEPVAVYPAGTKVEDIKHFDRGQHLVFRCPIHKACEGKTFSSKDPYCSSWFSAGDYSPSDCDTPTDKYVLKAEYLPTRNG